MFRRPIVYIQVNAGSLVSILVGKQQRVTVSSKGLSHPRTLMGDFIEVESSMSEAFKKLGLKQWNRRAPIALTHLIPKAEGGYTNVELRAFREAALGAGAVRSYLLIDHPVLNTDEQAEVTKFFGKSIL